MSPVGADAEPARSAIVAYMASGHHLLTIRGYSGTKAIPTGECVKSRPFTIGGHLWRIDYYPNGATSEVVEYISLDLVLDEVVAGGVTAKCDICLTRGVTSEVAEEEAERAASLASRSVYNFPSQGVSSCSKFVKREDLESSKHLKDDSFTIRIDIVIIQGCQAVEEHAALVSVPPCDLRWHLGELLETKKGADVVFKVGRETVAAHRCILAARSPVFSAELFGPMKEGNATMVPVRIEDMDAGVFKALLYFVYTGLLPETRKEDEQTMYQHLLVAADRYGMERLKMICEEKLCEHIDVGSAATILALADQHHCEGLKKVCFCFLAAPATLRLFMATNDFQQLSESCPSVVVELMAMSLPH